MNNIDLKVRYHRPRITQRELNHKKGLGAVVKLLDSLSQPLC